MRGSWGRPLYRVSDEGAWLIPEDEFVDYCRELVDEIGDLPQVPDYVVIDWEATANNLRVDYSTVEYDDTTYLYR